MARLKWTSNVSCILACLSAGCDDAIEEVGPDPELVAPGPINAFAIEGDYVYWVGAEGLFRVAMSGGTPELLSPHGNGGFLSLLDDIDVAGDVVAWLSTNAEGGHALHSLQLADLRQEPLLLNASAFSDVEAGGGFGVALVDDGDLGWVYVWQPLWETTASLEGLRQVAVDESFRFGASDIEIRRFGADTGPNGLTVSPTSCPQDLQLDDTHVYWTEAKCATATHAELQTRVMRAPKLGGDPSAVLDLGLCAPNLGGGWGWFDVDGGRVYFGGVVSVEDDSCRGIDGIHRVPVAGGDIETLMTRRSLHPFASIEVGGGHVFFIADEGLSKLAL